MGSNSTSSGGVAIVRFSALGDVAMAVPVVYPLCKAYPSTQFYFVTRTVAAGVFVCPPPNLTVLPIDVKSPHYDGLCGMWRLAAELREKHGITRVCDLHSVLRSWTIDASMRLHGVAVAVIDKGRRQKRALTAGKIHRQLTTTHERYRYALAQLGFTAIPDDFASVFYGRKLPPLPFGEKEAGERWIAIAPLAKHKGKIYPLDKMRQVVEMAAQLPGAHVFLMGGKGEKQQLRQLAAGLGNVTSLAELKHDFTTELALMARCDVMVTMDSANMHLASLVGLPCVTVWGATHPYCGFMGWRQSEDNAVQLQLPCRPCSIFGNKPCRYGDYHCLTDIEPQAIFGRIEKILGE